MFHVEHFVLTSMYVQLCTIITQLLRAEAVAAASRIYTGTMRALCVSALALRLQFVTSKGGGANRLRFGWWKSEADLPLWHSLWHFLRSHEFLDGFDEVLNGGVVGLQAAV